MQRHAQLFVGLLLLVSTALAQSGVVVPGDNLVVEGVPPIPTALVEDVQRYSKFRMTFLLSWHPARREMLISTRTGDTHQVHLVTSPGGARTQLTFFPDRVGTARFRPQTGDYFVFSKDVGGNEFFQLYRYDVADGHVTLLTDGQSRNTGRLFSHAGDRLAYSSTRRNGKDTDIYLVDPADPQTTRLLLQVASAGWGATDWSPDDRTLLVSEYVSVNESYVWLLDATTGEKTLLTPKGGAERVAYSNARFSKDSKGLYVTTDKDSEFKRLTYIDFATQEHTPLTNHLQWDVVAFELSPDGSTIAFLTNEDGVSGLHLLDTTTRQEKPVPPLPVGVIGGLEWHENGHDLGFALNSARSPTDVYALDTVMGKVERWTRGETDRRNPESLAEPALVRWQSLDERTISGFLYMPPPQFAGPRPVVIAIHGGPEEQARPTFLGRNNYYVHELGVALLFPNVRGSSGYGKTFLKLDNGFLREDAYRDIGALLDWIKTQPRLDASRVMVTGVSYGGHMTFVIATRYNDQIRAALSVVGISNLVSFLERTEAYRRDLRRAEYGDERDPKMREFLLRIAPLHHAVQITKPLFVVAGGNDPRVSVHEAEQMVSTVRQNGTPVWYLMATDEGHGFAKQKNQDYQFYATVMFMREYLLK